MNTNHLPQHIHDDTNGLNYTLCGDYYIPDFGSEPEQEPSPIGKWGRMHLEHLKQNHPGQYTQLLLTCQLYPYLADLDRQAEARRQVIIHQMSVAEDVTERLKATYQMEWVRRMNSIAARADEIICAELIFT